MLELRSRGDSSRPASGGNRDLQQSAGANFCAAELYWKGDLLRVGGSAYTSVMGCGFIERSVEEAMSGNVTCLFVSISEVRTPQAGSVA